MPDRRAFALSDDFWAQFVARHWERAPGVFTDVFPEPIFSPGEAFTALLAAFDAYLRGAPGDRPRCYLDGAEVTDGALYARFLPRVQDGGLDGYAQRIGQELGRRFGVVVNAFHVHHRELWYRLRHFFRGLYALTGLPAARTDPVLFFGNYPLTPFGVHTDAASVFTFSLGGPKRMLLWPKSQFESTPRLEDRLLVAPDPFVKSAIDQRIGARDLMYWPHSHWHVGVAEEGAVHASLGVGVYFASSTPELLSSVVRQSLAAEPLGPVKPSAELPPAFEAALNALDAGHARVRTLLHAEWLRRVTSDGVQPAPEPREVPLQLNDRLQLGEGGKILHVDAGDALLVAGNGHSWLNDGPRAELLEAIDGLNSGELVRLRKNADPRVTQLLAALVGAEAARVYQQKR